MLNKTILTIAVISLFTSCSFNKAFLKPVKIPAAVKRATIATPTDTTVFSFSGDNHQPVLSGKGGEISDPGYTIESVIFKSSDGNKLNGWFLKPKNSTPAITLLHLHGNEGSILSQSQAITPLLKNGFQIFVFDYSGFGFSEGVATRENILTDALSALDYIKTRPEVINTKLVVYGQSLGGHLAAVVAAQRQEAIDGLVIEAGFSSHKDIAAHKIPVLGRVLVKQGYSAVKSIRDFHKPVLIIHSTEDREVPFSMGRKIFDNANSPKEFYEVKRCHICAPAYYPDEISTKIKHMPGIM